MPFKLKDTKYYEAKKRALEKQRIFRRHQQEMMRILEADIGMVHSRKEDNGFRRSK